MMDPPETAEGWVATPSVADRRLRRFDSIWIGLIVLISQIIAGLTLLAVRPAYDLLKNALILRVDIPQKDLEQTEIVAGIVAASAALIVGSLWLAQKRGIGWPRAMFSKCRLRWYFASIGTLAVALAMDWLTQHWLKSFGQIERRLPAVHLLVRRDSPIWLAIVALAVGPVAAIGEEVLFRGLLHRWFRERSRTSIATLASAVIFGVLHFHFISLVGLPGLILTADVVLTGILLATLYEASGSLWPSILLHACLNTAYRRVVKSLCLNTGSGRQGFDASGTRGFHPAQTEKDLHCAAALRL